MHPIRPCTKVVYYLLDQTGQPVSRVISRTAAYQRATENSYNVQPIRVYWPEGLAVNPIYRFTIQEAYIQRSGVAWA